MRSPSVLAAAVLLVLTGCAAEPPHDPPAAPPPPPAGAAFDYQLGGAYEPAAEVRVVVRDRIAAPADGRYSVCYVNAFQTQPGERGEWPADLLLTDAAGHPIADPAWPDEVLLDIRRADEVAAVVAPWIRGCAADGFDAVEFDNLDSHTRSEGILARADAVRLAALLVDVAHDVGLAAAQKNAAEDAALLQRRAGFDFAIAEECAAFEECAAYTAVYGDHVLAVEYDDALPRPFADVCADGDTPASVVLRDRALAPAGDPDHVFALC